MTMGVENVDNLKKMVSTQEVADIIGKGIRTVQNLTKSGILTCEKVKGKNQYNLYTVIREYCSYVAKKEEKKYSSAEEEKTAADARIKTAKAEIAELELMELKGRLHAAEDVEDMTADLALVIRSSLVAMPGRVAVELADIDDATEISECLKKEIYAILEDLSNYEYNPEEYRKRVRNRRGWLDDDEQDEE